MKEFQVRFHPFVPPSDEPGETDAPRPPRETNDASESEGESPRERRLEPNSCFHGVAVKVFRVLRG